MIDLDKLQKVQHIITHKDCPDGIASAMILKDVLPEAKVTFIQYNTPEQRALPAEPGMLFCDFSPANDRIQEFKDVGTLVLDHHKFARETVEAFGENGVFADETTEPGVCGAVLAYRHVWFPQKKSWSAMDEHDPEQAARGKAVHELATLAGIRDTWQKDDPRWKQACEQAEALRFWPLNLLIGTNPDTWPGLIQPIGSVIFNKNLERAKDMSETSYRFTTMSGTRVIIFGGASMSSDTAEAAGDSVDLVVGFSYKTDDGKPIVIYSTRSHTDFNCGAFCKAHGGGGHTKAAGFSVKLDLNTDPNPFQHFRKILEVHETIIELTINPARTSS
jgi:oligoribonuclease NrnB/cAMP/cGMP phosphodiesterase (DHH superfamily)